MKNPATFRRTVAGGGLVLTAVLMAVAMGTDVPFSGDGVEVLTAMDDAAGRAWLSAMSYLFAQLAMIAAALGVAHLLRERTPLLSNLGGTLAVLGAFGHTVHGGGVLLTIQMSRAASDREAHAAVLDDFAASPAGIFSAMGLIGTVLGLVLLSVGLWRAKVGPRWVAPALGAFIVLEFVGAEVSPILGAAAAALYLACFIALALTIWRSPARQWQVSSTASDALTPA